MEVLMKTEARDGREGTEVANVIRLLIQVQRPIRCNGLQGKHRLCPFFRDPEDRILLAVFTTKYVVHLDPVQVRTFMCFCVHACLNHAHSQVDAFRQKAISLVDPDQLPFSLQQDIEQVKDLAHRDTSRPLHLMCLHIVNLLGILETSPDAFMDVRLCFELRGFLILFGPVVTMHACHACVI
eukprot:1156473-Pelagomonas_calceolata.AAC.4